MIRMPLMAPPCCRINKEFDRVYGGGWQRVVASKSQGLSFTSNWSLLNSSS
ncbi:hypothetical protein HanXRQr2_Chr02g0071331 [Helianthus annuus]|uniref:Uncharacterized protein n=1 Tax=Helianthus annuus TaxID=4232 RepID=A0A9K3JQR2_HELAN|nr:hypothetical protein HanXRQr2_Chr02g0071331 [Helianthus annuus]